MKRLALLACTIGLSACGGLQTADLDIGEHSLLIVRERAPPPGADAPNSVVIMARFDRETGRASSYEQDVPRWEADGSRWHLIRVAAGEYVMLAVGERQGAAVWAVCFDKGTYAYRIGNDEALYVGSIDLAPSLEDLNRQVVAENKGTASAGSITFVHDNIRPPQIRHDVSATRELAAAQAAVLARTPESPLTVKWAEPTQVTFTSSRMPLKMVTCGG
jgi:hypothetical protein